MDREIEFRGKEESSGKWVYGFYNGVLNEPFILSDDDPSDGCYSRYCINPKTVGQYTGLKDKNGIKIFEGDILRHPPKEEWDKENYVAFEVFFHDNDHCDSHIGWQFNRLHFQGCIAGYHSFERFKPEWANKMIIIGNVFDSPELIRRQ